MGSFQYFRRHCAVSVSRSGVSRPVAVLVGGRLVGLVGYRSCVRWSGSLGEWVRRERLLVAFLAGCAAVVGAGVALGLPQLSVVGAVVAAVGALAKVVVVRGAVKVERSIEGAKARRHLRVPVGAVAGVVPTDIGVDPAVQAILLGGQRPEYVERSKDAELREALSAAVTGRGPRVVVVRGPSKVGKSRSLFEALLRSVGDDWSPVLVAPVDGEAVTAILTPGEDPTVDAGQAVLWLDDLEPFLNSGVTLRTLNEWNAVADGRVVVATYGGKGSSRVADEWGSALTSTAQEVLQHAAVVTLAETTGGEVEGLRSRLGSRDMAAVERHGLAAFLVAGPLLEGKLNDRRHDPGEPESPEGVACVHAVVDWARCGRTDPIPIPVLRELWASRCPAADKATFDDALRWAIKPVAGSIALVTKVADGIEPFDYVVRLVTQDPEVSAPTDEYWDAAIDTAENDIALVVGERAYEQDRLEFAVQAFRKAERSDVSQTAAIGGYNTGVVLGVLGRSDEAIAVYDGVVVRFGDDTEPAVRERVAMALFNKGVRLGGLGRSDEEIAVYDGVVARFGDDTEPAVRERVAGALFNKGVRLGVLGRSDEEIAVYDGVVARFGDDTESAMLEVVRLARERLTDHEDEPGQMPDK